MRAGDTFGIDVWLGIKHLAGAKGAADNPPQVVARRFGTDGPDSDQLVGLSILDRVRSYASADVPKELKTLSVEAGDNDRDGSATVQIRPPLAGEYKAIDAFEACVRDGNIQLPL